MKKDHITWKGLLGWGIVLGLSLWLTHALAPKKPGQEPIIMDITINNDLKDYINCCGLKKPYDLPFIKIKSIGFKTDTKNLYIKYTLGGALPKSVEELPKISGDQTKGVMYYMSLDENYLDATGNKNPPGDEAFLKIGFLGAQDIYNDKTKLVVDGDVVEGGLGHDYFIVKYPYYELMMSQSSDLVVFQAWSISPSQNHPAGASRYEMRNVKSATSKDKPSEIKVYLKLKTTQEI